MVRRALAWTAGPAALLVIALAGLGAWVLTRDESTDCGEFAFDRMAWKRSSERSTAREQELIQTEKRRLARGLVECDLLFRQTKRRVRELLGSPDSSGSHRDPLPVRSWSYDLGTRSGSSDLESLSLGIDFAEDGRVLYAAAPTRGRLRPPRRPSRYFRMFDEIECYCAVSLSARKETCLMGRRIRSSSGIEP